MNSHRGWARSHLSRILQIGDWRKSPWTSFLGSNLGKRKSNWRSFVNFPCVLWPCRPCLWAWSFLSLKMKGPGLLGSLLDQEMFHFFTIFSSFRSQFNSRSHSHALAASAASWAVWQETVTWWWWEQKEGAQTDWESHWGLEKPVRVQSWPTDSNKHCHLETSVAFGGQRSKANKGVGPHPCLGPWEPLWQSPGTKKWNAKIQWFSA